MSVSIRQGTIFWKIQRGTTEMLTISKDDGWSYDQIVMDIKIQKEIDQARVLRLSIGSGIVISGNDLIISLSHEQTGLLKSGTLYADIKLVSAGTVFPPIPFQITVEETVTKI